MPTDVVIFSHLRCAIENEMPDYFIQILTRYRINIHKLLPINLIVSYAPTVFIWVCRIDVSGKCTEAILNLNKPPPTFVHPHGTLMNYIDNKHPYWSEINRAMSANKLTHAHATVLKYFLWWRNDYECFMKRSTQLTPLYFLRILISKMDATECEIAHLKCLSKPILMADFGFGFAHLEDAEDLAQDMHKFANKYAKSRCATIKGVLSGLSAVALSSIISYI